MKPARAALLLALLLLAFGLGGLALLPVPFTRDQGIYAYVAWRWLGGDVPYLGAFDHKGPLLYAVFMLALKLSGGAMWGPNLADLLARAAAVALAYPLGRRFLNARGALYAAVFTALPLFGLFNSCWWNDQAETFMLPLLGASAFLALDPKRRPAALALAGVLAAQAVMLKPTALLHGLFLLAWVALRREPGEGPRPALCLLSGLAAGVLAWIGYFAARGALGAMWEVLVVFNSFHGQASLAAMNDPLKTLAQGERAVFGLIPLLLFFLLLPSREDKGRGFILLFAAASFAQVLTQGRFFLYHWLAAVPAAGLAAGAGLSRLHEVLAGRWRPLAGRVVAGAFLLGFAAGSVNLWYLVAESYRTRDYLAGRIDLAQYYARFSEKGAKGRGDFNLLASAAAAHYLRLHVPPSGRVLVFGYEPLVNYLAARPAPTRFEIDYPLTFTPRSERAAALRRRWRLEFMTDLQARPPAMVVLVANDRNAIEPEDSNLQAREFAEFGRWLEQGYQPVDRIEDFTFYAPRRAPQP
jgi:hypothetical protein